MKTKTIIYKYEIPVPTEGIKSTITIPNTCVLLCANEQNDKLFVWAEFEPDADVGHTEEASFLIVPTGYEFELDHGDYKSFLYMNTVFMKNGLVFHIYTDSFLKSE